MAKGKKQLSPRATSKFQRGTQKASLYVEGYQIAQMQGPVQAKKYWAKYGHLIRQHPSYRKRASSTPGRKTPVRHTVKSYKRKDGTNVIAHKRGTGTGSTRSIPKRQVVLKTQIKASMPNPFPIPPYVKDPNEIWYPIRSKFTGKIVWIPSSEVYETIILPSGKPTFTRRDLGPIMGTGRRGGPTGPKVTAGQKSPTEAAMQKARDSDPYYQRVMKKSPKNGGGIMKFKPKDLGMKPLTDAQKKKLGLNKVKIPEDSFAKFPPIVMKRAAKIVKPVRRIRRARTIRRKGR